MGQASLLNILELMLHLYDLVGEWRRTKLPDEENAEVLLTQKRLLEHWYVQIKTQKVKLWEIQEELEASEICMMS